MATIEVKLAKRGARLRLNNDECKVIIEKCHPREVFVTAPGIFIHEGVESVSIPSEHIIVPITDITRIEVGNRFNPNIHSMMKVDWDD